MVVGAEGVSRNVVTLSSLVEFIDGLQLRGERVRFGILGNLESNARIFLSTNGEMAGRQTARERQRGRRQGK